MLVNSYINIGLVEDPEINVKVNWKDCFEDEHKYFFTIFKTQFAKSLTSSKQSFFSSNSFSNFFLFKRERGGFWAREREREDKVNLSLEVIYEFFRQFRRLNTVKRFILHLLIEVNDKSVRADGCSM